MKACKAQVLLKIPTLIRQKQVKKHPVMTKVVTTAPIQRLQQIRVPMIRTPLPKMPTAKPVVIRLKTRRAMNLIGATATTTGVVVDVLNLNPEMTETVIETETETETPMLHKSDDRTKKSHGGEGRPNNHRLNFGMAVNVTPMDP